MADIDEVPDVVEDDVPVNRASALIEEALNASRQPEPEPEPEPEAEPVDSYDDAHARRMAYLASGGG